MKYTEDTEVREFENVPDFIDRDITIGQLEAIQQAGCASGAYMPAVEYHSAMSTMSDYGSAVFDCLEDSGGTPTPPLGSSWVQMACFYVSCAVELWADSIVIPEHE